MIRSMTGFGRAAFSVEQTAFEVEVRSVNHRYLDARVRLPRPLAVFETEVRAAIRNRFARGKVELTVIAPAAGTPPPRLEIDLEAVRKYLRAAEQLGREDRVPGALEVGALLGLPGVSRFAELDLPEEDLRRALLGAVDSALDALDAMRVAEGANLERELLSRLDRVAELGESLEGRVGAVQEAVRERLRKRAQQLERETGLLDEARLHQEIVIAADRFDITEEIVRLHSHERQFREIVASAGPGEPIGRRLDFLLQELARETNTIGSKGADAQVAHQIVELKAELERLREQVQNIE